MAVTSSGVKVIDMYEYSDNTQRKTWKQTFSDAFHAVRQAPCHLKGLGAVGVICAIGSMASLASGMALRFTNGTESYGPFNSTNDDYSLNRTMSYVASASLAGISAVSLGAFALLTCKNARRIEFGELEFSVNEERNIIQMKYGDVEKTLDLKAHNFIGAFRKYAVELCAYSMENGGDVRDAYELVEAVCKYLDSIRDDDSCTVFVLRNVREWFQHKYPFKFKEYQKSIGETPSREMMSLGSGGNSYSELLERINNEREEAEFTFNDSQSLAYDDEQGTEFAEVPL